MCLLSLLSRPIGHAQGAMGVYLYFPLTENSILPVPKLSALLRLVILSKPPTSKDNRVSLVGKSF